MAPRCSVLTVVRDSAPERLAACLASVRAQTLDECEHVVVVAGPRAFADASSAGTPDPRVTFIHTDGSIGDASAHQLALGGATGDLVALLAEGDELEPTALARMSTALDGADLAYSDHDLLDDDGRPTAPCLKPDFSPERLRCHDYVQHLVVARRELVEEVGGFRPGTDGAVGYDLLLRISEHTDRIRHVPQVLYHARARAGSPDAVRRAVADHLARTGVDATVEPGVVPGVVRIRRVVPTRRVSVIIPTRGSSRPVWGRTRCFVAEAVRSMCTRSSHPDLEFVVVYDTETPRSVLRALRAIAGERLRLVEFTEPFNFSTKINVGAAAATGELLLILNDDTELIAPDSVEAMAALLDDPTVGMVGAKLLFADGTIQDGGHVYHEHVLGGLVGWSGEGSGPRSLGPLAVTREVSGVTAAAAMIRRDVFDEIGGFDPALWMNFNDVDVSLKVRATGRRILWTPEASWYHFESQTRPPTAEPEEFAEIDRRWHDEINRDPYYHPLMVGRRADWLELPWHSGHPPVDDVDADEATSTWVRERLLGVSRDDPWAWLPKLRILFLAVAAAAVALTIDRSTSATSGWVERLATTWFPLATLAGAVGAAIRRERWALASGVLLAAPPAWIGAVGVGVLPATAWAAAVLAALAYAPLRRRRPPVALAVAGVAAVAVAGGWWWHATRADDALGRGWADAVAPPVGRWEVAAVVAIVSWSLGLVALTAWAWRSGCRWLVAALAGAGASTLLGAWVVDLADGSPAALGAIGLIGGVSVACTARVDHRVDGARPMLVVVCAAVVVAWLATALAATATAAWDAGSVALVVIATLAGGASSAVIATRRRDAPFSDPALDEARQGRPGERW